MSCVTFLTDEQPRRLRVAALDGAPVSTFRSPEVTGSTVRRLATLARDPRPGIRASAAHRHAPGDEVLRPRAQHPLQPGEVLAFGAEEEAGHGHRCQCERT